MNCTRYFHSAAWFLPIRVLLSFIYGAIIGLRNWFYDLGIFKVYKVKVPIISVGNISVGGSGKTILVQALVHYFLKQNMLPSVLSRGYGRDTKGLFLVADKEKILSSAADAGDEPYLIAKSYPGIPVIVSENRVIGASYLLNTFQPDVIILDDGFQHRRLHRTLDLVILDLASGSSGHLLPWGRLREPLASTQRADLKLYSKGGLQDNSDCNLQLKLADFIINHQENRISLSELKGTKYGLFAGLGNPDYFFNSLETLLGSSAQKIAFPDHVRYSPDRLERIERSTCSLWITTEKDFVKLDPVFCYKHNVYSISVSAPVPPALTILLKQHFKQ